MSSSIEIFDNQAVDGDSAIFTVNRPNTLGYADTGFSAYIEIYGGLGGGTLSFQKKAIDGLFRELEIETAEIASDFPSVGKMLIKPINYKSDEQFMFVLSGATAPTLSINGYNLKKAV